jgi:hypothetical protein
MLSDEPLLPEQTKALEAHVVTCDSCQELGRAWDDVRDIIASVQPAQPAEGFSERWQARFDVQSHDIAARKQRQSWWFFFIAAGLAVFLFAILLTQLMASFNSPIEIFLSAVQLFTGAITFFGTLQGLVVILVKTFLNVVPPVGWFLLTGVLCALIIIWIVSLRLVIYPRRISP